MAVLRRAAGPSPIDAVLYAGRIAVASKTKIYDGTSLPGHLIHFHISGRAHRESGGRQYVLGPGCAIWYYDDEVVRLRILEGPVVFYSVHFSAPLLPPPDFEARFFEGLSPQIEQEFEALVEAWEVDSDGSTRDYRVHAATLRILSLLSRPARAAQSMNSSARLWWQLEQKLRGDLAQRLTLQSLAKLAGRNAATVAAACKQAVGVPPMKRIKQIRMSYARGLVQRSEQPLKEIAALVGYERIHEFSRDYRKQFGRAPSVDRKNFRE